VFFVLDVSSNSPSSSFDDRDIASSVFLLLIFRFRIIRRLLLLALHSDSYLFFGFLLF
jgi:hypothetical protein